MTLSEMALPEMALSKMALSEMAPADRHRHVTSLFTERVLATPSWDAPAPVEGWTARDVVRHLTEWLPAFLAAGAGADLPHGPGQDDRLDPGFCAQLLAGLQPIEQILRSSGQYGPRVEVPAGADTQTRLLGFIGRDPYWSGQ
jgi:hypothetical protein